MTGPYPEMRPGIHGGCKCGRQHWRVSNYHCNYSAFNGYHQTFSDYSRLVCLGCRHTWRTKAAYVEKTPMWTSTERADYMGVTQA